MLLALAAACVANTAPTDGVLPLGAVLGRDKPSLPVAWDSLVTGSEGLRRADSLGVIVGNLDAGTMRRLSAATGQTLWSATIPVARLTQTLGDTIWTVAGGWARGYRAADGAPVDSLRADSITAPTLLRADATRFYLFQADRIAAIDRATRTVLWNRAIPCPTPTCQVNGGVASGDTLFVSASSQLASGAAPLLTAMLDAYSATSGTLFARYEDDVKVAFGGAGPPALGPGGVVLLPTGNSRRITAVDRRTMRRRWFADPGMVDFDGPPEPAMANGLVGVTDGQSTFVIDAATGAVRFRVLLGGATVSLVSRTIACGNRIVVLARDAWVLDPQTGQLTNYLTAPNAIAVGGWRAMAAVGKRLYAITAFEIVAFDC